MTRTSSAAHEHLPIEAVLLDLDGTLIDSNDAHAHAWVEALQEEGIRTAFDIVRPLIGMGGDKLLRIAVNVNAETPQGKRIAKRKAQLFANALPRLRATAGARSLLQRLRDLGLSVVIATSAHADEVRSALLQADLADLVDTASSADEAEESKPDPDIVLAALHRAGVTAAQAVLIGDTPYDVDAGRRAALETIALRCGGWWSDEAFGDAAAIYDDPSDLLVHFAESPLPRGQGIMAKRQ